MNGKFRQGLIIALATVLTPFFIWYMVSDVKTHFAVKDMNERLLRVPTGDETIHYVETYDKYQEAKKSGDTVAAEYHYEVLLEYMQRWRPTRRGVVRIIIP